MYKNCRGKKCYSKTHVEHVKRAILKTRKRQLRVYGCSVCHYYHLTSEKKNRLWDN